MQAINIPGIMTTSLIIELELGDPVMTPNGPGTYQGRWWEDGKITNLIVKHTLDNCMDENLVDIALQLGERFVIVYYPVDKVDPL